MSTILHITNRPTPYRIPYFREVDRQLRAQGDRLHVLFIGGSRTERLWTLDSNDLTGIDHEFVDEEVPAVHYAEQLISSLRPSAVVLGWAMDLTALRIARYCRGRDLPTVVICGESVWSARAAPWRRLRALFRRLFFRSVDGFLSYGAASTDYLRSCGLPNERIATGLNTVDTEFFARAVDTHRKGGAVAIDDRNRHLYHDRFSCHLLFVGYLLSVKGVSELLTSFAGLDRFDVALHIVGDGPDRNAMAQLAVELHVADRVFFHGYRQTSELPRFYAFADVVVFPSLWEVYGLVMTEAAAAGLPIIASRFAGGTPDVVRDGINGFVVDPGDADELGNGIRILADDSDLRRRMGEASRQIAQERLTLTESANRYIAALARFVSYIDRDVIDVESAVDEVYAEEREAARRGLFENSDV